MTPHVLTLPNFSPLFQITCDDSSKAIGAVLIKKEHHIAYFSQALKGRALVLSSYENELLALVSAIQRWGPYLLESWFDIKTDHQSHKFLLG